MPDQSNILITEIKEINIIYSLKIKLIIFGFYILDFMKNMGGEIGGYCPFALHCHCHCMGFNKAGHYGDEAHVNLIITKDK